MEATGGYESLLVERRRHVLDLINQQQNRSQQTRDRNIRDSIDAVLKILKKQLESLDKQIADAVRFLKRGHCTLVNK